jgi:hypothetical protein
MAEVVAVGLAVSIITIVEVSAKVLARLYEYHSGSQRMPRAFQDIKTRLPVIRNIMEQIRKECEGGLLTAIAQNELSHLVENCLEQVTRLEELIEKIVPISTDSPQQRLRKMMTYIRKGKDVAAIEKNLRKCEGTLILRLYLRLGTSVTIRGNHLLRGPVVTSLSIRETTGAIEDD